MPDIVPEIDRAEFIFSPPVFITRDNIFKHTVKRFKVISVIVLLILMFIMF